MGPPLGSAGESVVGADPSLHESRMGRPAKKRPKKVDLLMLFWPHVDLLLAPFCPPKSTKFQHGTKKVTFAFWASRPDESSTLGVQGPQKPPKVPPKAIKKSIKFQLWFLSDFWCQNGPKMSVKWGGESDFFTMEPPLEPPAVQEGPSDPPKLTFGAKMKPQGPPGTQKACQNDPQGTPETQK